MNEDYTSENSTVVGIFDDSFQAQRAMDELKQIGLRDDQIDFSMSENASIASSYGSDEETIFYAQEASQAVIRMRPEGRHQEVVDLLHRYGASDVREEPVSVDTGSPSNLRDIHSAGAPVGEPKDRERWDDMTSYYRSRWQQRYSTAGRRWEDYEPAYRYGWERANMSQYRGKSWSEVEPEFRSNWERGHHESPWDRIVDSVRDAWNHITGQDKGGANRAA